MADYKGTVWLVDAGTLQGWSHRYYFANLNPEDVQKRLLALSELLENLNTDEIDIKQIQYKELNARGIVQDIASPTFQNTVFENGDSGIAPQVSARIKFKSTNGHTSNVSVHGLPADNLARADATKPYVPSSKLKQYIDQYINGVIINGVAMLVKQTPPQATTSPVGDVTFDTDNDVYTVTSTGHGLSNLDVVRIFGKAASKWPCLRGEHTIFAVTADTFQIRAGIPCGQGSYKGGLEWYKVVKVLESIISGKFQSIHRRKVGLPVNQQRGRRSNRNLECLPCNSIAQAPSS